MNLDRFRDHPSLFFVDWSLRGVGQVVFQNNPLSGLVILVALVWNSCIYAAICVLGVIASTATALVLKADRAVMRDGLYGFNGALVGLALVAFTSEDFRTGAVPSVAMVVYLVCAAAFTTMAFASIGAVLAPYKTAPLTMPFVLVGWLFLFAVLKFDAIGAGPMAKPVSPEQFSDTVPYVFATWYEGIGTSIGQIFFQFGSPEAAIVIFVGLNVIQFVIGSYIEPRVAGYALAMSPFLVLFSVFSWSFVWGVFGAFIGVPITIAILTFCTRFSATRWIAEILGAPSERDGKFL